MAEDSVVIVVVLLWSQPMMRVNMQVDALCQGRSIVAASRFTLYGARGQTRTSLTGLARVWQGWCLRNQRDVGGVNPGRCLVPAFFFLFITFAPRVQRLRSTRICVVVEAVTHSLYVLYCKQLSEKVVNLATWSTWTLACARRRCCVPTLCNTDQ